ncbi:outer membrane protein [Bartonella quintana]|uniref:outer membrane protein n=2 Tax=Bartonella TaxID=773 RepID=UPI0002D8C742|nr:outer membrane protein [Bartonella quintana]
MNMKFIIGSVFAFIPASVAQAADVIVPQQSEQVIPPVIASPPFSWTGFYFGGQIGGFSSKISATTPDITSPYVDNLFFSDEESKNKKWVSVDKKYMPKLSGFIGGVYAGANLELSNGFILGVDTDILVSRRKDTKTVVVSDKSDQKITLEGTKGETDGHTEEDSLGQFIGVSRLKQAEGNYLTFSRTLKQKWTGATRVRVGFPVERMMPYISGGIAYGQFQDIFSMSITGEDAASTTLDDTKTMIGYTLGGGVDFAMTDHFIVRAEYRYSDFGKKKFQERIELNYKTNDFRVGVAYKF